jgi:hypothetical protein
MYKNMRRKRERYGKRSEEPTKVLYVAKSWRKSVESAKGPVAVPRLILARAAVREVSEVYKSVGKAVKSERGGMGEDDGLRGGNKVDLMWAMRCGVRVATGSSVVKRWNAVDRLSSSYAR